MDVLNPIRKGSMNILEVMSMYFPELAFEAKEGENNYSAEIILEDKTKIEEVKDMMYNKVSAIYGVKVS